jgi:hypothetical protein
VKPLVAEVRTIEPRISTVDQRTGLHSDDVLELAPGLRQLGYAVDRPDGGGGVPCASGG